MRGVQSEWSSMHHHAAIVKQLRDPLSTTAASRVGAAMLCRDTGHTGGYARGSLFALARNTPHLRSLRRTSPGDVSWMRTGIPMVKGTMLGATFSTAPVADDRLRCSSHCATAGLAQAMKGRRCERHNQRTGKGETRDEEGSWVSLTT